MGDLLKPGEEFAGGGRLLPLFGQPRGPEFEIV